MSWQGRGKLPLSASSPQMEKVVTAVSHICMHYMDQKADLEVVQMQGYNPATKINLNSFEQQLQATHAGNLRSDYNGL
jgi:hypothetical protein